MPGIRLGSKYGEVRTGAEADLHFRRLPVQPQRGQGPTHLETLTDLKTSRASHQTLLSGHATRVTHRPVNRYRKASSSGSALHETHPVAPEKSWEDLRITRKGDPDHKISPSTLKMLASRQMSYK